MTALFEKLCLGPVAIIDDEVGKAKDVERIRKSLEAKQFPVVTFSKIEEAQKAIAHLCACSFIILEGAIDGAGVVQPGATIVARSTRRVLDFIKDVRKRLAVPIYIMTQESLADVEGTLRKEGLYTSGREAVFVGSKMSVRRTRALFGKINGWIAKHPHIYLAKWWTNRWNEQNRDLFWRLYEADPHWPNAFFRAFVDDGVDPGVALLATINQLVLSSITTDGLDVERFKMRRRGDPSTLRDLYKQLVYTSNNIMKDVRAGDVFLKDGKYYLNIRADCDTTVRGGANPEIYLLEGKKKQADKLRPQLDRGMLIPKLPEIIMLCLGNDDVVVFNKRKLTVANYDDWKDYKKWRIVSDHVGSIRDSFASFVGRVGVPAFPEELRKSIFRKRTPSSRSTDPQS